MIEWKSIIFVAVLMIVLLLVLKLVEKKANINGELKRKLFHITMGLVVLTFPYIFKNRISVVLIGIVCVLVFILMKYTKLRKTIGTILYSVDRESLGEIFFAISVVLIFYWSKGDKILYSIPILILTFADSTAALIGKNYGKKNLAEFNEDAKSIEGSFMFFIVAFMMTLVPLLLFTGVGREEILIISAIIGFNVALIEMISHTGNDNLLIPLTTFAFLVTHVNLSVYSLRIHLLILGIIFILVTIANRIKTWSKLALVETLVVGYLTISLYGIYAVIPPLILFFACMRFPKIRENEKHNLYDARIIETNVLIAISVCGISTILGLKQELFMIYCLCYSMHLAINTFIRFKYYFKLSIVNSIIFSFFKGLCFVFIPSLIIEKVVFGSISDWFMILAGIIILLISCIAISYEKRNVKEEVITIENGYIHMKIVAVLTCIMMFLQLLSNYFIYN